MCFSNNLNLFIYEKLKNSRIVIPLWLCSRFAVFWLHCIVQHQAPKKMNNTITAIVWLLSNTHALSHISEFRSKMNFITSQWELNCWLHQFVLLILSIFWLCRCKWIFYRILKKIEITNGWSQLMARVYNSWSSRGQPILKNDGIHQRWLLDGYSI